MDGVFKEKQIKIAAITESKKKLTGTINTNNYIIYGVHQSTQAQAGVMIWIHKSITNTIINSIYWSKTITEVKLNRRKLSLFGL